MPLYDFLCGQCGFQFEQPASFEERTVECPHECGFSAERLPALIGGYTGNTGGASTRPKNSTAMPKAKVFTGLTPAGMVEAIMDPEQLEFDFTGDKK